MGRVTLVTSSESLQARIPRPAWKPQITTALLSKLLYSPNDTYITSDSHNHISVKVFFTILFKTPKVIGATIIGFECIFVVITFASVLPTPAIHGIFFPEFDKVGMGTTNVVHLI